MSGPAGDLSWEDIATPNAWDRAWRFSDPRDPETPDDDAWWEPGSAFAKHADAPVPPMLVEGLIPGDGLTLLHADPRTLKTWIAEDIALALTTKTPALGALQTTGPVTVLYVTNEDGPQRTSRRLMALARGRGFTTLPDTLLMAVHAGAWLDDREWQDRVVALVKARGVRLVILDPIRSLTGCADQGPRELQPFTRFLRRLMRAGCAVLLCHHDTKPQAGVTDTRKRAYRASGGGLFAIADSPIHAERVGDDPVVLLHPNNWKFTETPGPMEVTLRVDGDLATLTAKSTTSATAADQDVGNRILAALAELREASGNKIAAAVRTRREVVSRVLEDLSRAGRVDSRPGPRHSVLWFPGDRFPVDDQRPGPKATVDCVPPCTGGKQSNTPHPSVSGKQSETLETVGPSGGDDGVF